VGSLWLMAGLLALLGGAGVRRLLRARTGRQPFQIDDEAIRQIQTRGYVELDNLGEELDLEEIRREEDEFWRSESWEDSEEY